MLLVWVAYDALKDCRVVLRLDCAPYAGGVGEEDVDMDAVEPLFALVALLYRSPFRATYRIFHFDGEVNNVGHLVVRGLDTYRTQFELCDSLADHLRKTRIWTGRCYLVHESQRPLAVLQPRALELEDMSTAPLERVFPRQPSGRFVACSWGWGSRGVGREGWCVGHPGRRKGAVEGLSTWGADAYPIT